MGSGVRQVVQVVLDSRVIAEAAFDGMPAVATLRSARGNT
jgi:hypothetical protein